MHKHGRLRLPKMTEMGIFFLVIAAMALGNGLSDSVYANYFKDAYDVTATQRGFIEFPREMPGLLCALAVAALSTLGDIRTGLVSQMLACAGVMVLGLFTPSFGVMLIFLFINSMGMHLFMPVQDAVCMSLAEPGFVGRRMGQSASIRAAVGFAAGILVFIGFRAGFFSFTTKTKSIFLISAAAFALAAALSAALLRCRPGGGERKRVRFCIKKQYKYFYILCVLHGVQKQIAFVYGSWVIVDILRKGADVMALLIIAANFICIFFMDRLGKWMDRFGIKRMMYLDAISFIVIYVIYGFAVLGLTTGALPNYGASVFIIYALFVLDRLSMQVGMVKSVYLRDIAWSDEDVTATLSTGTSLDHMVSITAAMISGYIWSAFGSHWVFFIAAAFSLGNLYISWRINPKAERALALEKRAAA